MPYDLTMLPRAAYVRRSPRRGQAETLRVSALSPGQHVPSPSPEWGPRRDRRGSDDNQFGKDRQKILKRYAHRGCLFRRWKWAARPLGLVWPVSRPRPVAARSYRPEPSVHSADVSRWHACGQE